MASALIAHDIFSSPAHMLDRFEEYVDWLEDNKLQESKLYGSEGEVAKLDRMRIPSLQGFCRFLRTITKYVQGYADRDAEYADALEFIEESIHAIAYEGAAAGLLKESIVIRKLGLADKTETNTTVNHKRVVILHTPDNGRAIDVPHEVIEEAPKTLLAASPATYGRLQ